MMEMEMNAELGGDDGSESSQPSSEGSSASDTFCTLERDYERITSEMRTNEALAPFEAEYARLYESLYRVHDNEKQLSSQCASFKDDIADRTRRMHELQRTVETHEDEMARLKREIVDMTKLADAAHAREQNAQEMIENLRLNITKLGLEIEQKNKQLAAEKDITVSKQKESLLKERERLVGEMETMRQRMKNMSVYTDELERKSSETEERINEMHDTMEMQLNDISRERQGKERAEVETRQLQEEIAARKTDLETAKASIEAGASNVTRLEGLVKEHKTAGEKMQKEISRLMLKRMNLQTDLDNASAEVDKMEKEIGEKEKQLRSIKHELGRTKDGSAKCKQERNLVDKQLQKAESERSRLERELKQAVVDNRNTEHEVYTCRREQLDHKQRIEALLREKNTIARNKETLQERVKRLNHELLLCQQSRSKVEHELDTVTGTVDQVKLQMEAMEKERDKYSSMMQGLQQQIEGDINEAKLKQVEILDCKKRLAEAETKYRQQQSLFDAVRAERNLYSKSLVEAQREVQDLKRKLKITSQQVEQLKEDIATKEASLVKGEFLLGRVEKEKENLKLELRSSRADVSGLRREIEEAKREEKHLRQDVRQADIDIGRRKKDIDNVMNERDILGTQLVRRNDELGLQYSRIQVLNTTLSRGEAQYNQRLDDIRLLKFEVKGLRTEKTLLVKSIDNVGDLRQEVFHLNRDLARERLKVTALEQEVQTPLNVHRWRKLEGTDPNTFELIQKMQILQRRILGMSADMIDKEKQIKDMQKLYANLREVLSRQPDPQVAANLDRVQTTLRKRGRKLKCLVAELNMYEAQAGEYKGDMTRMGNEMCELKKKYHVQKRKLQRMKEVTAKPTSHESALPGVPPRGKIFCGGGFRMTTLASKSCCIMDSSTSG